MMEEVKFCYVAIYEYFEQGLSWFWSVIVFFKIFGGHKFFLWGYWYSCLELLMMSTLSFQSQARSLSCLLCRLPTLDSSDSLLV